MPNQGRYFGRKGILLAATLVMGSVALASTEHPAVPGEYVVKLKSDKATHLPLSQLSKIMGGEVVRHISKQSNTVLLKRETLERADYVISNVSENPLVEYAEPNYIYTIDAVPNDPKLSELWGLINSGQADSSGSQGVATMDVDAERAWDISTGSKNIVVAVIDTGVGYNIAELAPNMWKNTAELNGTPGVDDDNNGFVDDIYGYDFANKDGDPMDDHGHGSHTSGTIGAKGNDGQGLVGVAWDVSIMGVKFLTAQGGGSLDDAIASIDYATQMGANIMSNSWGGGGYSRALEESIQRANDAGIIFIAAAGNSSMNNDVNPTYPATYNVDNVLSVAAVDNQGQLAGFSNYGKTTVDVGAPGVNVLSTTPTGYQSWSGTSMATPHVSGVAALLLSHEALTPVQLKERLIATAKPIGGLRGKTVAGMTNAYHALTNTTPPPDQEDPFNWAQESYQLSSPHPYTDNFSQSWTVTVPGATKIAVYFLKFDTERGYDKVTFKDAAGNVVGVWSGARDETFSPSVDGDTMVITMTSDGSVSKYGFDIEAVAYR
ncbi:MAG: S8 family serine peptidase [Bdellovibrionaceae bacterium]|nr:S8 family serine peptidase [Bdellovibrionales bacterium]MCB9085430.1 S8 family serine peptidase [Pseudobdellovibrionaceae bacterium]